MHRAGSGSHTSRRTLPVRAASRLPVQHSPHSFDTGSGSVGAKSPICLVYASRGVDGMVCTVSGLQSKQGRERER